MYIILHISIMYGVCNIMYIYNVYTVIFIFNVKRVYHVHLQCTMCLCSAARVWLFVAPWTVTRQAPLSMEPPRQEYWSGLPLPTPGALPDSGVEPTSLEFPVLAGGFFTTGPPEKSTVCLIPHISIMYIISHASVMYNVYNITYAYNV